jgi:hypothetical protein
MKSKLRYRTKSRAGTLTDFSKRTQDKGCKFHHVIYLIRYDRLL